MLQGTKRNNPAYAFFGTFEYTNALGGIGKDYAGKGVRLAAINSNNPDELRLDELGV